MTVFPVSRKNAVGYMWPSPDVIPEVCLAVEDCPDDVWNAATDLESLAESMLPYLERYDATPFDFTWQMERHFSEPFGPLPEPTLPAYAGVPPMFLKESSEYRDQWVVSGYTPYSGVPGV